MFSIYSSFHEVAWTQVCLNHQSSHEEVHQRMSEETSVKWFYSTFVPQPGTGLSCILCTAVHHGGLLVRCLKLSHHYEHRVGQKMGQDCWNHETVAWWGWKEFDPTQLKNDVFEEDDRGTAYTAFGGFHPDWKGWFVGCLKWKILLKWGDLFWRTNLDWAAMRGRVTRSVRVQIAMATNSISTIFTE